MLNWNFHAQTLTCTFSTHFTTQPSFVGFFFFCTHLVPSTGIEVACLSPYPWVKTVHYFLIIQIWKQLIGTAYQPLPPVNHGAHHTIITSKGPSHALLRSHVLPANVQEAHHACWAVKIQMVGSRWVMNAMLFPLKCTQLPHTDRMPSTNQGWGNPGHVGWWEISFHSKHVSAT